MHRIILLKGVCLVGFSHQYDYWSHAAEYSIAWAFVCFPRCIKTRQSIKKCILVNDNFFSHDAIALERNHNPCWFKSWSYNWAVAWSDHLFGCWMRKEGEGNESSMWLWFEGVLRRYIRSAESNWVLRRENAFPSGPTIVWAVWFPGNFSNNKCRGGKKKRKEKKKKKKKRECEREREQVIKKGARAGFPFNWIIKN